LSFDLLGETFFAGMAALEESLGVAEFHSLEDFQAEKVGIAEEQLVVGELRTADKLYIAGKLHAGKYVPAAQKSGSALQLSTAEKSPAPEKRLEFEQLPASKRTLAASWSSEKLKLSLEVRG
jgi:hypothetical protein